MADFGNRARLAFTQLYGWYRLNGRELWPIYRDIAAIPDSARRAMIDQERWIAGSVLGADAKPGREGRTLRGLAGHVVDFPTWHSLTHDLGLDDQEVIDLAVRLLIGEAQSAQDLSPRAAARIRRVGLERQACEWTLDPPKQAGLPSGEVFQRSFRSCSEPGDRREGFLASPSDPCDGSAVHSLASGANAPLGRHTPHHPPRRCRTRRDKPPPP